MRSDMSKIIVERPRRGSRLRNHKSALALDPRRIADDTYIDPPKPRHSGEKSLNENLAPLRRYLESNVGRPWSKVYAEIRATLDSRKATGLHILQHLFDFVAVDTWLDGRTVMVWGSGWPRRTQPVTGLYVHPVSGLLRNAPHRAKTHLAKPVTELRLEANVACRLVDGVWYRFEYAEHDPDDIAEVVRFHMDQPARNREYGLQAPGDRRIIRYRDLPAADARYLASRRQCARHEISEIDLRVLEISRRLKRG
jgi:hypothetical protein